MALDMKGIYTWDSGEVMMENGKEEQTWLWRNDL